MKRCQNKLFLSVASLWGFSLGLTAGIFFLTKSSLAASIVASNSKQDEIGMLHSKDYAYNKEEEENYSDDALVQDGKEASLADLMSQNPFGGIEKRF